MIEQGHLADGPVGRKAIDGLIEAAEGNPRAMVQLARTLLLPAQQTEEARELTKRAMALSNDDPELRAMARMVLNHGAQRFYFSMVRDSNRHALYVQALQKLLRPGSTVLDIGAGTGLFAMLAAREGASLVTACESALPVADAARGVVERNGLSDRVNLIAKSSNQLEVGVDMDERADVLIWDNLSNDLIGAGGIETLEDARERLLKPDAIIIPGRVEICAALAETGQISRRAMTDVEGFDLSPFNDVLDKVATTSANYDIRSKPVVLYDFDFRSGQDHRRGISRQTTETIAGPVDGIVQWLRFHLAPGVVYDTSAKSVRAFGQKFHPVTPFEATDGVERIICANRDARHIWMWLE